MEKISIEAMCARKRVLIDVRSPGEFMHGHTPQALNLPLFTDEEREIVGITYKKFGKRLRLKRDSSWSVFINWFRRYVVLIFPLL